MSAPPACVLLDGAPWSFFAPGLKIEADVGNRLGLPICSPALDRHSFVLVVAFGRCKFRLDPLSVGSILQATIGGLVTQFNVSLLSNRTFRFFVSSKQVGFYIADLRSFSCDAFYLEFHLWGNGGPNWRKEFALFQEAEFLSWKPAVKDKVFTSEPSRVSVFRRLGNPSAQFASAQRTYASPSLHKFFADAVRSDPHPPLSGANSVPIGPPNRAPFLVGARSSIVFNLRSKVTFMAFFVLGTEPRHYPSARDACPRAIPEPPAAGQSNAGLVLTGVTPWLIAALGVNSNLVNLPATVKGRLHLVGSTPRL